MFEEPNVSTYSAEAIFCGKEYQQMFGVNNCNPGVNNCSEAVSYTHLDVYKRQVYN